jgi:hypothetical protein
MKKDYKYEYCLKCKIDHSDKQDEEVCECGSRDFIFGDKIAKSEQGFSCGCGNPKLKMTCHMNCDPIYNSTYVCENCGAVIGKQVYLEDSYCSCGE